jgi:hypothetical protein
MAARHGAFASVKCAPISFVPRHFTRQHVILRDKNTQIRGPGYMD